MIKLKGNAKNIVIGIIILCTIYLCYQFINKREAMSNISSTSSIANTHNAPSLIDDKFLASSEVECSTKCNERGFSTYGYEDNKWCKCPDPASMLMDSGPVEQVEFIDNYAIIEGFKEGNTGAEVTVEDPLVLHSSPWESCVDGSISMPTDSLGYCFRNGETTRGLYEEMARYACLGDITHAIVKSILELTVPSGLANNEAYNHGLAGSEFDAHLTNIYTRNLQIIADATEPEHINDFAKMPNDKAFAGVILDRWLNSQKDGPTLIKTYIARNNCHTGFIAPVPSQSTTSGFTVVVGPAGTDGEAGATGWEGQDGGTGGTGADGNTGWTGQDGGTGGTGPDGSTGWTGQDGPSGGTGNEGNTGWTGQDGEYGRTGHGGGTGWTGQDGPSGGTGDEGSTGWTGQDGPSGGTGSSGMDGGTGWTGQDGATGESGPTGDGLTGGTGDTGDTGGTGDPGVQGPPGAVTTAADGTPGITGDPGPGIQFTQGIVGPNGELVLDYEYVNVPETAIQTLGCTAAGDSNYNPEATMDDGSCETFANFSSYKEAYTEAYKEGIQIEVSGSNIAPPDIDFQTITGAGGEEQLQYNVNEAGWTSITNGSGDVTNLKGPEGPQGNTPDILFQTGSGGTGTSLDYSESGSNVWTSITNGSDDVTNIMGPIGTPGNTPDIQMRIQSGTGGEEYLQYTLGNIDAATGNPIYIDMLDDAGQLINIKGDTPNITAAMGTAAGTEKNLFITVDGTPIDVGRVQGYGITNVNVVDGTGTDADKKYLTVSTDEPVQPFTNMNSSITSFMSSIINPFKKLKEGIIYGGTGSSDNWNIAGQDGSNGPVPEFALNTTSGDIDVSWLCPDGTNEATAAACNQGFTNFRESHAPRMEGYVDFRRDNSKKAQGFANVREGLITQSLGQQVF